MSCFRFIAAEKANYPVSLLCRMLGVSRSGFHAWQRRPPSDRALADAWLAERIRRDPRSAAARPTARGASTSSLRNDGIRVGRKRVERLMRARRALRLRPKRRKCRTTIRVPGVRVADDLVERNFNPPAPNRLWVSDIKYVPTWQGSLYLASVIDCYSAAGSSAGRCATTCRPSSSSTRSRWRSAAAGRPAGWSITPTKVRNMSSLLFGAALRKAGIAQSMGSKGDCYDNAVCESFHATLEKDLLRRRSFRTKHEARTAIFDYIEALYNRERRHSRLGYRSPAQYEHDHDERSDCASGTDQEIFIEERARAA